MSIEQLLARAQDVRTDEVTVEGIRVRVREASGAVHARYAMLWAAGKNEDAFAALLRGCVVGDDGQPCLNQEQAGALARANAALVTPIIDAILQVSMPEKKADAPGADGVPDQPASGAPAV